MGPSLIVTPPRRATAVDASTPCLPRRANPQSGKLDVTERIKRREGMPEMEAP
jgi:hypothetical protein